jgi:branched-subunit amino acid aminotransferase/4-amino-4-deoxychorismate lyase
MFIERKRIEMTLCYFNGKYRPASECSMPVTDLMLQRGVGVFESIRTYNKQVFAMGKHLERLQESAERCAIKADDIFKVLPGLIKEGVAHKNAPEGEVIAKPFITGGDLNDHGTFPNPRFFILFEKLHEVDPEAVANGITLQPNYAGRFHPLVKSINYLNALIPLRNEKSAFETLYCPNGEITESMASNFFLCTGGKIVTAPVGEVLRGVTRGIVLELARENGFKIEERCPKVSELEDAQEAFITGSVKEILPVVKIGNTVIGNGQPGPVVAHMRKLFFSNMKRWLDS